ncbi:MAG TPA: sulfite exporter TauE/SafE family protein [Stellaceae bacterium]|jgi:hypothetical protein|nr:sulfite exporter TauE/SafE family protein [Stellaceae bacterium]
MLTQQLLALPLGAQVGLALVFVFGGIVKGVTGVGLPLVLVPLTAQLIPVAEAVALVSVPMVATNVTQAAEGGHTLAAIQRIWPILILLIVGTLIGVHLLVTVDRRLLSLMLGICFLGLAALLVVMPRVRLAPATARWMGPFVGLGSGVIGGMSAMFGPPMIAYLVGLGTEPDSFVKQMAIFAFTAALAMLLALGGSGTLSGLDLLVSAAAIVPIQIGMAIGRWLRRRIKPGLFRALVLVILAAGGIDLLHRAWQ